MLIEFFILLNINFISNLLFPIYFISLWLSSDLRFLFLQMYSAVSFMFYIFKASYCLSFLVAEL